MATQFIVDPRRFHAEGAVVDWQRIAKLVGIQLSQDTRPTVQLRWMLRGDMGMPTEPFQVWERAHSSQGIQKPLAIQSRQLDFFFGYTIVTWASGSMSYVSVDVSASAPSSVFAFAGGPLLENITGLAQAGTGNSTLEIGAHIIDGLLLPPGVGVTAVRGIATSDLSQAAGWQLKETVGLPVKQSDWNGIGKHGQKQGLLPALMDAQSAAVERLTRGAPPLGWGPLLAPGFPAPPWTAPSFPQLVIEVNKELLSFVKGVVAGNLPNQQVAVRIDMPVPPPRNSAGVTVNATSSNSRISPLGMTLIGAGSDPFLSLVLGFGTAYPWTPPTLVLASRPAVDYMITAHWENGLDGSGPIDYAAIIPAPSLATPPPVPANLATEIAGLLKPLLRDREWRCTSRISWDKTPAAQLFRTCSFAAARAGIAPSTGVQALMDTRASGGFRPIAVSVTDPAKDPAWWRNNAVDRELPIPPNPGSQTVKYGIAMQDLYGQWTRWAAIDEAMQQPALDRVRIVTARLTASPVPGSVCPATLEVEFLWDWSVRTPERIQFAGLLYAAAEHGTPSPIHVPPAGLARTVGGADPLFTVNFGGGDTPSAPGATFIGLDGGGETNVGFGAAQGHEGRRYRMTLPGFSLNFNLSGHFGLGLWARAQEHIAPQRTGAWSVDPVVVTASDPRPPIVPVEHVQLGSLPDAAGQSHARIAWGAQPGATGYFIYESDETQILKALSLHEPTPDQTLDDRLKIVRDNFAAIPRRAFTRLNSTPLTVTSADVAMPKGSTAIHFYMVIGSSAGQVESEWPADKDKMLAAAAPHIMTPAPPMLEVERFLDTAALPPVFKARVNIRTRPGPRAKKLELHRVRVDDAAKEVDTMGPPVARIETSGAGWIVANAVDTHSVSSIATAQGIDAPPGSWRRVWYRATAWTEKDDTRGGLPGRSPASTAAWIVIPPADGPAVTAIAAGSGPGPNDVTLEWTSTAPLKRTPLGPHLIAVRASVPGSPSATPPLLSVDAPLDKLPTAAPVSPASGVWIFGTAAAVITYRAVVRRAALTDPLRVAVRITDPLGRTGEALKDIPAGPVDPAPDLSGLVLHKVPIPPPGRLILQFTSSVPLTAPADGPYKIRVSVFPKGPAFPPALPTVVEVNAGAISVLPLNLFSLGLFRQAGAGPAITYVFKSLPAVSRFVVRITAPDGRFVEQVQLVV